jgi:hypothetical protein
VSLILDALNRSRQDSDPVPGLATEHFGESPQQGWRQYLPWSALLVALLIIGALLLERGDPAPVAVMGPAPAVVPEPEVAPQPAAPAIPQQEPAALATPPPAADDPVAEASPVEPAAAVQPPAPSAGVDPEITQLYSQEAPDSLPAAQAAAVDEPPEARPEAAQEAAEVTEPEPALVQQEQPVDIEKLVLQAQDEVENARLAEHPAPFVSELSQQTKDAIPTVYYQRHDYSDAGSTVVLNGKSLKVGGSPAPGMKVMEILPDSVVLDYRGTEFRLRALNSWINL